MLNLGVGFPAANFVNRAVPGGAAPPSTISISLPQVSRQNEVSLNTEIASHDDRRHLGQSAMRPIQPRCRTLAALLLLAGKSPPRRRALPAHRITAHSGASNSGFQVEIPVASANCRPESPTI